MQTTANQSTESGFLRAIMSLAALIVTAIILLPVVMALLLPLLFSVLWIWSISIPASLVYGTTFYYVVTALVAPRMYNRIPEILAVVARE
jgi:hypothetical protein